jgi:hypothetical protein
MTQKQQEQIRRLLKLADISQEFEHIELKLSDLWCEIREEHGLAKTILMIEEYVKNQTTTSTGT